MAERGQFLQRIFRADTRGRVAAYGVAVLLCLPAFPAIAYVGGRRCGHLIVPPLLPAQVVPLAIGLFAGIFLIAAVVASLVARRHRTWTLGTLAVAIAGIAIFVSYAEHLPGFLHGLRDCFATKVGYATMREFAREVTQEDSPWIADGVVRRPDRYGPASLREQEQWDNLIECYPFLGWRRQSCAVFVGEGKAEVLWGSPLTGHWGFQVSTGTPLREPEEDRGTALRVADDIQFVSYSN